MLEIRPLERGEWCVDTGRRWFRILASGRVLARVAGPAGIESRPATKPETAFAKHALRWNGYRTKGAPTLTHLFDPPAQRLDIKRLLRGMAGVAGLKKPGKIKGLDQVGRYSAPAKTTQSRND